MTGTSPVAEHRLLLKIGGSPAAHERTFQAAREHRRDQLGGDADPEHDVDRGGRAAA